MTWKEIADTYSEIGGLKYITVDNETFIDIVDGSVMVKKYLLYDRCFDRVVNNDKILSLWNMKQEELMPLKEELKHELNNITLDDIGCAEKINEQMDIYLAEMKIEMN